MSMFQSLPLTGKRVYGNGSFAPNRGQVSAQGAQGYLKRNLNMRVKQNNLGRPGFNGMEGRPVGAMRVGNDGRSDTRSGVAQAALNRMNPMARGGFRGLPNPGGGGVFNDGGSGKPGGSGFPGGPHIPGHEGGMPAPGGGTNGGAGGGTPVPKVTIGANGQIALPYDAGYSDQVYSDLAGFNDQLMQLQMGQQQQAAQYAQSMRNEGLQYNQQKMDDLRTNAGAGTAFSSRYATDVGQTALQHQNNVNDLDTGNTQYNQQVAAQRAAIQDNFNQELQAAAMQRARNADQKAGSLGYGDGKGKGGAGGHNSDNGKTDKRAGGHRYPGAPGKPVAKHNPHMQIKHIKDILKHGAPMPGKMPSGPRPPKVKANR